MRLEGRNALVTGGASGIGAATARRIAAEGARVAVADLDEAGARDVAGEIDGLAVRTDVADAESARTGVGTAEDAFGPLDVVVLNAGTDRFAFVVDTDEALWDFVLGGQPARHDRGHPRGARRDAAARLRCHRQHRLRGGPGRLAGSAVYSAAKTGVIGVTGPVARESSRFGVRVNAVAPGPIETPLLNAAPEQLGSWERGSSRA